LAAYLLTVSFALFLSLHRVLELSCHDVLGLCSPGGPPFSRSDESERRGFNSFINTL
jgi:hypothetical protein